MAMPVLPYPERRRYSVTEVLGFPSDGNRYEVVEGELLVTPAPQYRHQLIVMRLAAALREYLQPLGHADRVLTSPADITWGQPPAEAEDLVQPDVFVVDPRDRPATWLDITRLALAAEIISPSNARADRVVKRRTYQRHAVGTYWVVDPDAELVEEWQPHDARPLIVTDVLTWTLGEASTSLRVPLVELFAD